MLPASEDDESSLQDEMKTEMISTAQNGVFQYIG